MAKKKTSEKVVAKKKEMTAIEKVQEFCVKEGVDIYPFIDIVDGTIKLTARFVQNG